MTDVIEFRNEGAVGVITINNPPANALSFAVVKGIADAADPIILEIKENVGNRNCSRPGRF